MELIVFSTLAVQGALPAIAARFSQQHPVPVTSQFAHTVGLVKRIRAGDSFDVAILTLGHKEHLGDVVAGYGTDVDRDLIRAWWSLRCLTNVRWLAEHGYGSPEEFPEVAVLRSRP